jgi:SAM-dependent methyltransferase
MDRSTDNGNLHSYAPFPLEMEHCACPICHSNESATLLRFDAFGFPTHTVECLECGGVYVNPRPTKRYMDRFYRNWFRFFYEGRRKIDEKYIRAKHWREWDAARVSRYAAYLPSRSHVLDIGCGAGFFAAYVKTQIPHSTVDGIEPDSMMAQYGREKLNLEVYEGFFETFPMREKYTAITAFHVIEHLFDLRGFFGFLRDHLESDGVVIVETPNVDVSRKDIGMFHIAHLYTFSPKTIRNLFHANGFEVVDAGPLENDLDFSNLYLIARVARETARGVPARDLEESARIEGKCRSLSRVRALRVVRNWAKITSFGLRV